MAADVDNFRGRGTSASQGAGGLLGLGVLVLGGRRGAGGCPGTQGKRRAVRARRRGWGGMGEGGAPWQAPAPDRGPGVPRGRALTGRDDIPSAEQLQVREDAHEVGHAGVAVDPGPKDAGRALSGALTQPQLRLVAHDQGGCGPGGVRSGRPGPARPSPVPASARPPARRHPPNWHQSAGSRASITL